MNENDNLENECKDRIKKDPMSVMFGMVIETSMETTRCLIDVVNKYKAHGIDAVPLSELEECLQAGHKKSLGKDSFLNNMLS